MVVSLFVSIAVARYLGPEDFGLYHYVLSIVALVSVITNLGLHSLAKRELVEHPEQRDTILGTCFVLNLFAGLIAYAAMLWIVSVVSDSSLTLGLFALLGGGLLLGPLKCIEVWFQSQVRSDLSFWASSLSLSLFAAAKVAAIFLQADLLGFAYIFLCELVVLTGLQVFLYRRHFGRLLAWRPERRLAMDYLKQAWPLLLSGLAVTVYMKIDQVMLGAMLGDVAVGQYSVAVRISSIWYFVPTLLATSLFPAILNARKQSGQLYTSSLQHYFDLNAGLAYLVCLPLSLAAPWIIALLFGADYAAAAPILTIHASEYRISSKGFSGNDPNYFLQLNAKHTELLNQSYSEMWPDQVRTRMAKRLWEIGRGLIREGGREQAVPYFEAAKGLSPMNCISGGRVYVVLARLLGPIHAERIGSFITSNYSD